MPAESQKRPVVVNVRGNELSKRGYRSFLEWAQDPTHLYIGRSMESHVPGTCGSKWGNPFKANAGTLQERLQLYEAMVRSDAELMRSLPELLHATEIGCWCHPAPCHGDVLLRLLDEHLNSRAGQNTTAVPHAALPCEGDFAATNDATPAPQAPGKEFKKKTRLQ